MSKKTTILFPFRDRDNVLLSYISRPLTALEGTMKTLDEARFTGTLRFLTYTRGRSSAILVFTDDVETESGYPGSTWRDLRHYNFFMSEGTPMIPLLTAGKITGTFVPVKRGTNYGWSLEKQHES